MNDLPRENLHMVSDALRHFPRPDTLAIASLQEWLAQRGIDASPLDIDVVTFHYQLEPLGEGRTHFRENAVITQKMNLVEALLGNWQGEPAAGYGGFHYGNWAGTAPAGTLRIVPRLETHDLFSNYSDHQVFNGLYHRTLTARYSPDTRLPIRAEDFQGFIWGLHFHTLYKDLLDTYWANNLALYQRALKINFIAACNRQVTHGSLSQRGRTLVWQAAGLIAQPVPAPRLSLLNVYGYPCPSILCLHDPQSGLTLLYMPGNRYPFHEFTGHSAMQHWIAQQCQDPDKRNALQQCFVASDLPDGLDFSGARTALNGLAAYPRAHRLPVNHPGFATSGVWPPEEIVNYRADKYSPPITGEVFSHLARWQQKRSYADADSQIVSNQQIDKSQWTHYLNVAMGMLLPVAMVLPALAPVLAIGSLAQFSLGMDAVINGKSLEEQDAGVQEQVFGLFNATPLAGNLAEFPGAVFRYCRPGFFASARLSELVGEPLGAAPVLEAIELQPAEAAFHQPQTTSAKAVQAVSRQIDSTLVHRFLARLNTAHGVVREYVEYELGSDSFIPLSEVRQPTPERWVPDAHAPSVLIRLEQDGRRVTDAERMSRLASLGIHVDLPIDFSRFDSLSRTPLPRLISSIWTGNKPLGETFVEALAHNAQALNDSQYRYQLLLSRQDPNVYQDNLVLLRRRAPGLKLVSLEDHPFFQAFVDSPFYPQYRAALGQTPGSVGNFSSACDILRYRLLAHSGGIYLDADDLILLPGSAEATTLPLDRLALQTTRDGLVLAPPVSNDQMGLYIKFNNSLIGSHPDNPVLDAISEEILRRYQRFPDFYRSRPDPELEPALFNDYARRLNQLTGPGVLNDVIDQHLPWLRQLREMCNLLVSPLHDLHQQFDLARFLRTMREHVPLDQVASIGSARSWRHQ